MEWIRTKLYTPNSTNSKAAADDSDNPCNKQETNDACCSSMMRKRKCPLHKLIRQGQWEHVVRLVRMDPRQVLKLNAYGWSSLALAVYHKAPTNLLSEMLEALSSEEQIQVMSAIIPNGKRLCLHFATRYLDDLEAIRLLTEAYPQALLVRSQDGILPLERAVYYHKDRSILEYLQGQTRQQKDIAQLSAYNQSLRVQVLMSCRQNWTHHQDQESRTREHVHEHKQNPSQWNMLTNDARESILEAGINDCRSISSLADPNNFVTEVYGYTSEREMIGLFANILSYVGVSSIP